MNREKGVAGTKCPGCGAELSAVRRPDGGQTYASCGTCYPATSPTPERSFAKVSREVATPIVEAGEEVEEADLDTVEDLGED